MDPLLVRLFPVLAGLFAGLALVRAVVPVRVRARKPELVREVWLRYASWGVLAGLLIGSLALGRAAWVALVGLLALVCVREFAHAVGLWLDRPMLATVYATVALIHVMAWWPWADPSPEPGWYGLFLVMPAYGTLVLFLIPIARDEFRHMLQKIALAMLAIGYIGWFLGHYAFMANLAPGGQRNGYGLVLFLLFVTALNDVGAYATGKLLGRHKLRPALSPGKTWEGWLGSLVFVQATAFALRWLVPYYSTLHLVVVAVLLNLASTAGDLALSVIKRDLGIKDWGKTLPGHGGMLDRLNSLIFATPVLFHYTRFFF